MFSCSRPVVRGFLIGYFSGDGFSNSKRACASSKSRKLLIGVAHLLSYFDIDCRIRRGYNKQFRRYYYHLSVIGTSSRVRFMEEIGLLQSRFQGYPRTSPLNKELLPVNTDGLLAIKREILHRTGKSKMRKLNFHDSRRYNISLLRHYNVTIKRLWALATGSEKLKLLMISRMINSQDVSYDEVVSVRRLTGPRVMYDFSVPGLERFVAGNLPTLLHNSQTPEYLKKIFYETLDILSSVKSPEDFERARANTRDLLTRMISDLKGKRVPVQDLAFTVLMGKPTDNYKGTTPQHVRAAKQLEERGEEVKAGEIIAYVKTKNPPYVKPSKLARQDEVDADKYIEYAHSMFDQLLDALDFSFDEIMGATTLDLFWSS
jgi:LAGLIDADG-like domain/DNA polymerase family B